MRTGLAACISLALSSCGCPEPPDVARDDGLVPVPLAPLDEAFMELCTEACMRTNSEAVCAGLEPAGVLVPDRARCDVPDGEGAILQEWRDLGVDAMEAVTEILAAHCEPSCAESPAYAAYLGAGLLASEIEVSCRLVGTLRTDARIECSLSSSCAAGRLPRGALAAARPRRAGDELGEYWANAAFLEQAAVLAFIELAQDLAELGAPPALIARARAAARDEVRHTHACRLQASVHGAMAAVPVLAAEEPRSLEALALHNARHGCVLEAFAAAQCLWQASRARDAAVRALLRRIGGDETRHGQLAWDIDAWARARLSPAVRRRLDHTRDQALAELPAGLAALTPNPALAAVGLDAPAGLVDLAVAFARAVDTRAA